MYNYENYSIESVVIYFIEISLTYYFLDVEG